MNENKTTKTNDFTALEEQLNDLKDNVESAHGSQGVKALAVVLKNLYKEWDNDINDKEEKELNKKVFEAFNDFFRNTGSDNVTLHLKDDEGDFEDIYTISNVEFNENSVTLIYSDSEQHRAN